MWHFLMKQVNCYFAWKLKWVWKGLVVWLMCIFIGNWLLWLFIHLTNTLWKAHLWAAPTADRLPAVMDKVTCGCLCHLTLHMCITGKNKHLLITDVNQTNQLSNEVKSRKIAFLFFSPLVTIIVSKCHLQGCFRPHHKPAPYAHSQERQICHIL